MTFRAFASKIVLAAVLAVGAVGSAHAVTYTLQTGPYDPDGDGPEGPLGTVATATFVFTSPGFITSPLDNVTLDSCTISGAPGYSCTTASFYPNSNPFGGTDDYIGFNSTSPTGSGTGFLFFQNGALGAPGVYSDIGFPQNTPGFGNFAEATLTVSGTVVPVPAALPMFAGGLGLLGLWARRRRQAA